MTEPPQDAGQEEEFAYLSLNGKQFEAKGMPASTAVEVARFRDAVYEIARDIFLTGTAARRVPDGFERAFDLRLTEIGQGSARPKLILHKPEDVSQSDFDEWLTIYKAARDQLVKTVATVRATSEMPPEPPRVRRALRQMGSTLGGDDTLTMGAPEWTDGPRTDLDLATREVIRRATEVLSEVPAPSEVEVEGVIFEFDSTMKRFKLRRSSDNKTIQCHLVDSVERLTRTVRDAISLNGVVGADVRVLGQAHHDDTGDFTRIFDVESVTIERTVHEKAMMGKIEEINALEPGWWGADSQVPLAELIDHARELAFDTRDSGIPIAVAPTADGGINFEWHRNGVEYTAELDPDGTMFLCSDNTANDNLWERAMPYDREALVRFFRTGVPDS